MHWADVLHFAALVFMTWQDGSGSESGGSQYEDEADDSPDEAPDDDEVSPFVVDVQPATISFWTPSAHGASVSRSCQRSRLNTWVCAYIC